MTKRNLLIVPTRNRPEKALELLREFNNTAEDSDIIFGLDDDDTSDYAPEVREKAVVNPRLRMCGTLNLIANKYADKYKFLSFMGDDHRPRTNGWDTRLMLGIGSNPGVAWGNDLLQGERLPTAVLLSSSIVRAIGYMAPPELVHMYMDNFWLTIGKGLGNAFYDADCIIEHMHFINGKAERDAGYIEVNAPEVFMKDSEAYHKYLTERLFSDLGKIQNVDLEG
jgi:hypothetical protein